MEDQRQKKVQFIEDYIGEGNIGEGEDLNPPTSLIVV